MLVVAVVIAAAVLFAPSVFTLRSAEPAPQAPPVVVVPAPSPGGDGASSPAPSVAPEPGGGARRGGGERRRTGRAGPGAGRVDSGVRGDPAARGPGWSRRDLPWATGPGPPRRPQPDSREMTHAPHHPAPHHDGPGRPGRRPATEAAGAAGLENASNLILGWLVWGARVGGVAGVLICALMIIVGRRNRNQMATEGVFSLAWVFGGLSLVAVAASLVGAFL